MTKQTDSKAKRQANAHIANCRAAIGQIENKLRSYERMPAQDIDYADCGDLAELSRLLEQARAFITNDPDYDED